MHTLRVLILHPRIPFQLYDGGALAIRRVYDMLRELPEWKVGVVAMNTRRHWVDPSEIAHVYDGAAFWWAPVDNRITPVSALWNLINGTPYHVSRFWSTAYAAVLERALGEFNPDVVFFEGLPTTLYIELVAERSSAVRVYRAHNIENSLWERVAAAERSIAKRLYLREQARRLAMYEQRLFREGHLDGIVTITAEDAAHCRAIGFSGRHCIVPFSVDLENYPPRFDPTDPPTLFHIGSLHWEPNRQGLEWFLREIFPRVRQSVPWATFHIAGALPANLKLSARDGVVLHGIVPDAITFMQNQSILVVPLLSGSGIRSKIIEAMALGKAVISTSIGAEGIECIDGIHYIRADAAEAFANAVVRLLTSRSLIQQLGQNARRLVEERYSTERVRKDLAQFLYEVASTRNSAR
jgi:glycosyltransferase involved in cell wall biosynthesis